MSLLATSSTGSTAAPPQTSAALAGAANGAIAWTACGEQLRVREGAGAAELGTPARRQDQARGDPPPRQSARGADRLDVREPGRTRRLRRAGPRGGSESGRCRAGSVRRRRMGHPRRRRQHPRSMLRGRRRARFFGNWSIPTPGRQSRRIAHKTATLARRCGEVSGRLLRHISTADTARDLDHLRRLVGDRRLTYVASQPGRSSARPTPTCFRAGCGQWSSTGSSTPVAYTRGTEAGGTRISSGSATEGSTVSCRCARARGRPAAHWLVTVPWRRAWIRCWRSCGAAPSRPRPPIRQAS